MAEENKTTFVGKYLRTLGRRKTAVAQCRLYEKGTGKIVVNGLDFTAYFDTDEMRRVVKEALTVTGQEDVMDIELKVLGGGKHGQAEACRLGIARALIELNPNFRPSLKAQGFLTRDARRKERKKPGLKRARRAPQWSKR